VAKSSDREALAEFSVTDLGFQGRFSAELGVELSFCLHSISPFHIQSNHHEVHLHMVYTTTSIFFLKLSNP
jgi:hypothetical protein